MQHVLLYEILDVLVRVEASFACTSRAIVDRCQAAECLLSSTLVDLGRIHCGPVQVYLNITSLVYINIKFK